MIQDGHTATALDGAAVQDLASRLRGQLISPGDGVR